MSPGTQLARVPDVLLPIRQGFFERMRAHRLTGQLAVTTPRWVLAAVIALVPSALLLLALAVGPEGLRVAATEEKNVHDLFGRVIAGLITASTIAVSVSAFTLRGDMKDFARFLEEQREKEGFRDELRELLSARAAPLLLSELLAETMEGVAAKARETRTGAGEARGLTVGAATLEEYLLALESRADLVAERVRAAGHRPDRIHLAALDLEHELVLALARRFLREELPAATRERLEALHLLLRKLQVLVRYAKKLDLEWGLSRMSYAVLGTTVFAVIVAAVATLTYGPGAVDALGTMPVAALVCAGLAVILAPIGAFASHLVRFVFLNQHTLAHDGFVLGPEEPMVAQPHRRPAARRPA